MSRQAERRPGPGEIWLAVTKHDGVQVDSINLTLEALGDRWSLIVIRDLMFGNRRHFRELLYPVATIPATSRRSFTA